MLSTNVYEAGDRSGKLKRVEYGNGGKVHYEYDGFDRLSSVRYDEATSPRYEYEYGANGEIARVKDKAQNRAYESEYDLAERPMEGRLTDGNGNVLYQTLLKYNGKNELSAFRENWNGKKYVTKYTYDADGRTTGISYAGDSQKETVVYDTLGRIKRRELKNGSNVYKTEYSYSAGNNGSNGTDSAQVSKISQSGEAFEYGYDAVGNITTEKRNGNANTYSYDGLGQLTRANLNGQNSWTYEYDRGGNLVSKKKYAYTTGTLGAVQQTVSYEYGNAKWKDQLTKYNGKAVTYDGIGNPTSYDGWTYEWQAGRQLKKMVKSGTTAEYTYDHNGQRVKKAVNGVTTEYMLHGKLVTGIKSGSDVLKIAYDEQSRPAMVEYNGVWYGYVKNLQGDIVGIIDNNGTEVVKYSYDAWGKVMSTSGSKAGTLGKANPFRYRGYVYDEETGLYYLRSRYYSPEWGRFLNADLMVGKNELLSNNVYCYCGNLPVNRIDKDGREFQKLEGAIYIDDLWGYRNHYEVKDGKYKVQTEIICGDVVHKYNYDISNNGVIGFVFDENPDYFWYNKEERAVLASAMYAQAKEINKEFMSDRTTGGLMTELEIHYIGYKNDILTKVDVINKKLRKADMGGADSDGNYKWFEAMWGFMVITLSLIHI